MVAIEADRQPSPEYSATEARSSFANIAAAAVLTIAVAALSGAAGWLIAGKAVAVACTALAIVYVLVLAGLPPAILMPIYRARALAAGQGEHITALALEIGKTRAGLPRAPQIYVLPSLTVTAFSIGGRTRPAIALSEGLLREMTMREIAGIIAHETAHVLSADAQLFALSDAATRIAQGLGLAGLALGAGNILGTLFDEPVVPWPAVLVLYAAPAIIGLVQRALPRNREFAADASAVQLSGDALGLAAAIRRLTAGAGNVIEELTPPAFARKVPLPSALRAHPAAAERIERLLAVEPVARHRFAPIQTNEEPMVLHAGFGPAEMRRRFRWPGVWW